MRVMLVTGSRALCSSARARRWACKILMDSIIEWRPDRVVHGDAIGPDTWADVLCRAVGVPCEVWRPGALVTLRSDGVVTMSTHCAPRYPLSRNRAMVDRVARLTRDGGEALAVALHAPWSTTEGTSHTAAAARASGLRVAAHTAPADMAEMP